MLYFVTKDANVISIFRADCKLHFSYHLLVPNDKSYHVKLTEK